MNRYSLSDAELTLCVKHTDAVRTTKVNYSVRDRKFDTQNSSYGVNLMGFAGEVIAGRHYGWKVDKSVHPEGDDGYDTVFQGSRVQVKTSTLSKLIFNDASVFGADIAVLVQMFGDRQEISTKTLFIVHGAIRRKKFLDVCYARDYGYGERLVCDIKHLGGLEVFDSDLPW